MLPQSRDAAHHQIRACLEHKSIPEKIPAAMFEALYRLLLRTELPYYFMQTENVMDLIRTALKSNKEGVVFWALEVLRVVVVPNAENRDTALEESNKQVLLGEESFRDLLMKLLDDYAFKPTGTTVIMATHASRFVNIMYRRVVTMVDGRIFGDVERGRYGDVL